MVVKQNRDCETRVLLVMYECMYVYTHIDRWKKVLTRYFLIGTCSMYKLKLTQMEIMYAYIL